jgi:hypothetical protein
MTTKAVTLKYYSKDQAGNDETVQTQLFNLNKADLYNSTLDEIVRSYITNPSQQFTWTPKWSADAQMPHVILYYTYSFSFNPLSPPPEPHAPEDAIIPVYSANYSESSLGRDIFQGVLPNTLNPATGSNLPNLIWFKWQTASSGLLSPVFEKKYLVNIGYGGSPFYTETFW